LIIPMMRLQQSRNIKSNYKWVWVVVVLLILVGAWKLPTIRAVFSTGVASVAEPFWAAETYVTERGGKYLPDLRSKRDLIADNKRLATELVVLRMQYLNKELLAQENAELKELLGRHDTERLSLLSVVLTKPNRSLYDTLIIDVGATSGVETGNRVLAHSDITIGEIDEVFVNSSRVKLYSSPGEELDVTVGRDNVASVARGTGNGNFEIQLPHGVDIKEGDAVSFPTINAELIGLVQTIIASPSDSFQTLLLKSPVNIYELKWVEVLLN